MKKLFPALALCITAAAQAGPMINVGTVYDYLESDKSTYLKRVFNGGESTAFVRINLFEISFDADDKTIETSLDSMDEDSRARTGLIASPARLIVPPKGMQATRLLYRGSRDVERYYRVRFVPVMPEREDNFEVSDAERSEYKESMSAGINILAGYGTIFFVRPESTRFDTKLQNGASEYAVNNAGNSTVVLSQFKDCSAQNPADCLAEQKHHVRPGKQFSFVKDPARSYSFKLEEGEKSQRVEVGK